VQFDARSVRGNFRGRIGIHQREFPERLRGEYPIIDVGDHFTPFIENLRRVVAALYLRHFKYDRRVAIDREPGFEIGGIEVRIHPIR